MKSKISWMDIIQKEQVNRPRNLLRNGNLLFLEGIDEENRKHGMPTLLENQNAVS